ncbi:hypothetical protein AB0G04_34775 [Actinoplanes sp. NPDC023801]|uniref:hypothetical protein n=1 Tax=Actinoplanes sp. NPDC023801 TaxID=3154595 RepID=UPI0033C847E8
MRSPLQGGMPPPDTVTGAAVEIACDESGFSGTNLHRSATPMITHASVDLTIAEAAALIAGLRDGLRLSPRETKSGHFLRRPDAADSVGRFLAALPGRAHVHLVEKEFFLVTRVVDLLAGKPSYLAGTRLAQTRRPAAVALHRHGRTAEEEWDAFLAAFEDLVRTRRRRPGDQRAVRFLQARDALARHLTGTPAADVLGALTRERVRAVMSRLDADDRTIPPPLEPMLPALAETILTWSAGRHRVLVVHDEQSALTADRLTRLQRALAAGPAALPGGVSPLAGLVMADSREDPRIQVADLLAGVARRPPGFADPALLRPLVSPTSLIAPPAGP